MSEDASEVFNVNEVIVGPVYLVYSIVSFGLIVWHAKNMYSDFYTDQRSSLEHRRNKPKKTQQYKRMGWLTMFTVLSLGLTNITLGFMYNFAVSGFSSIVCNALTNIAIFPFQASKALIYLVYIYRLKVCYGLSAYAYKERTLKCCIIFIIVFYTFLAILTDYTIIVAGEYTGDADGKFPYHCLVYAPAEWRPITGGLLILMDVVLGITAIISFQVPIKKLLEALDKHKDANANHSQSKSRKKMLYTGFKCKVLIICATTTTIIWILIAFTAEQTITNIFSGIDWIVNTLCVMLMTPYYPDDKYYQTLCKICICCCDRNKNSYQSKASAEAREKRDKLESDLEPTQTATQLSTASNLSTQTNSTKTVVSDTLDAKSIDTMDVPQHYANKTGNTLIVASDEDYTNEDVP